jgi:FAD-dependent urate hydroxylase
MSSAPDTSAIVIGAGPHGLAAVAHLRGAGIDTKVFGDPLGFWRDSMPAEMWLRSPLRASHISDPGERLSQNRWSAETGREMVEPQPIGDFIDYGVWFQERAAPDLDRRYVANVERRNGGFAVTLEDGSELSSRRVVVAAGLGLFPSAPPVFGELSPELVSHASASPPMADFKGKSVAVIGAGQSATEGAALLSEAGAEAELIARAEEIFWLNHGDRSTDSPGGIVPPPAPKSSGATARRPAWRQRLGLYWRGVPTEVGGKYSGWLGAAPDVCHVLPRSPRAQLTQHCIKAAAAPWLPDRLRDVTFSMGRSVTLAEEVDGKVRLCLSDGSERTVDHVLLGTGYKIDVSKYPFLDRALIGQLRVSAGSPVLTRGLESSVPGLHFVGAPAAESFGPVMRFVVGTAYTAPALTQGVMGETRPLFRWAF